MSGVPTLKSQIGSWQEAIASRMRIKIEGSKNFIFPECIGIPLSQWFYRVLLSGCPENSQWLQSAHKFPR
jgi:hypothetical protein